MPVSARTFVGPLPDVSRSVAAPEDQGGKDSGDRKSQCKSHSWPDVTGPFCRPTFEADDGLVKTSQQFRRIAIDGGAAGLAHILFRKAAAKDANRPHANRARGFHVIWRVSDHDGLAWSMPPSLPSAASKMSGCGFDFEMSSTEVSSSVRSSATHYGRLVKTTGGRSSSAAFRMRWNAPPECGAIR